MLSLSPEPRAQSGKVPEGPSPPRGCARRGPGGSTRHQGGPEQRRASGRPRQAAAPPGASPGRWLPSQPGAVVGTRESRAPRHRSTRSPARPPTRDALAPRTKGAAAGAQGDASRCLLELCGHRSAAPGLQAPGAGGGRGGGGESGHRPAVPPPCRLPTAPAPGYPALALKGARCRLGREVREQRGVGRRQGKGEGAAQTGSREVTAI